MVDKAATNDEGVRDLHTSSDTKAGAPPAVIQKCQEKKGEERRKGTSCNSITRERKTADTRVYQSFHTYT